MKSSSIVQLDSQRFLNLTTYVVIGVMYLLGSRNLADPVAWTGISLLCIAFGLLYTLLLRRENSAQHLTWYFGAQTVLVGSMLILSGNGNEFFTILFFILAIHAGTFFPQRNAALWIAIFYAVTMIIDFSMQRGDNVVPLFFNLTLFILCGMIGHILRQTELARRHNQQLLEELQVAQGQLQELAVAEERNRLAREIHDGLGHYLTATTMQIQGAKALLANTDAVTQAPVALTALGKAETLLQEALADVRRSVATLRAGADGEKPLAAAIAHLVDQCRGLDGLDVQFDLQGVPRNLNSQAELALYRVVQEGLTNVRKHAQATHVEVLLGYEANKVCLRICDNGKGMGEATGGFGLLGLRERVELQGGKVRIDSQSGQGFQLEVEIPT
jgi:signal transduction histidine kinase